MEALRAYRESELTDDNPVRLVILLYDQLLRDLQRALDAFEKADVCRRCAEVDHALVVLAQLQGTLDLERGGEVAQNLDRFYDILRNDLLQAIMEGSPEGLKRQWSQVLSIREAWLRVEQEQAQVLPANQAMPSEVEMHTDGQRSGQWKA